MVLIKGAQVCDPAHGQSGVLDVLISGHVVAKLGENLEPSNECEVIDGSGKILVPGLVDMHVHFRDPGYEYKEDISTGVRAATKGGFSDVATMPNTDPVTDTGTSIRYQIDRGIEEGKTRVRPIGALTRGEKGEALAEIGDMTLAGAVGFSDDGHGVQSAGMMRTCMAYVSQFDRAVIAHCEVDTLTKGGVVNEGRASTRLGMFGWPALGEELEIMRDIELCRLTGCPLHVAHISTARSLDLIRKAKACGLPVSCEVTPHHLFLTEEAITCAFETNLKMNPPLRTEQDARALCEGLVDGSIDCVASDHAPHAKHEKDCEFEIAAFGTIGLETSLPLMLTHLVRPGVLSWERLVEVMAITPRKILRLPDVGIFEGSVADLVLIDPQAAFVVDRAYLESKASNSAFMGETLVGRPLELFVSGRHVLRDGEVVS